MRQLDKLIRPSILALDPYSSARDEYNDDIAVLLDANENPYGDNLINRYPDPHQRGLKGAVSEIKGIREENIFIGNGSDEAIDLSFRIFCSPSHDNVVAISPTYGMYEVEAAVNDIEMRKIRLNEDFSLPTERILSAIDRNTKIIWLCSPNNPTGNIFSEEEIEKVIKGFDGIVILDEAYIDFSKQQGFLKRLDEFQNLIILQTLSKAWGLAGLRIGLAFADSKIIGYYDRVKYPYNISAVTQKYGINRLRKENEMRNEIKMILSQRAAVECELEKVGCVEKVYPSDANFLLVKVTEPDILYQRLVSGGIVVRNRSKVKGCEGCLRITIGTSSENQKMLEIIKKS